MNPLRSSKYLSRVTAYLTLAAAAMSSAVAAPISLEASVATKEQIRFDFADGSKHFVAMVRRDGKASGGGPLDGAAVIEYGRHDIVPGVGGDPSGYLVFSAGEGDVAYVKYLVRAVYVPGADGKTILLDGGIWEVVGSAGRFKGLRGAGTLRIRQLSPTDRKFTLDGEMVQVRD
ncbi:MAG: hypothetical protein ACM3PU_02885 [Gemmatimonadota bacterium]